MRNHQTSNIEPRARHLRRVNAGCAISNLLWRTGSLVLLATGITSQAQLIRAPQSDPLSQLMVTQPSIEIASNVVAVASFDPPVIRVGDLAIYRVTFNALEESITWPEDVPAPMQLEVRLSARGQVFQHAGNQLKPLTTINHHVRASATGLFTLPEFTVEVYGRPVTVPATRLEVVAATATGLPTAQRLVLQMSETNAYAGQPLAARVLMPGSISNVVQGLQNVKLNGDGFLVDQSVTRQSITTMPIGGRSAPVYVYETVLTPLVSGKVEVSAQGFTLGQRFNTPILIPGQASPMMPFGGPPQNVLLDSDPVTLNVRPLPRSGTLPGFTGVVGQFAMDPPLLGTNRVRLGDSVNLAVTFRGDGHLVRFVPPRPPVVRNWQISDAARGGALLVNRPGLPPPVPGSFVTFTYTLTPLTTAVQATPAIPFSYFDPKRGEYVDLTIPSLPVTVLPGVATTPETELAADSVPTEIEGPGEEEKLVLSGLAASPGRVAAGLVPLQQQGWFMGVQSLPVLGFAALWAWDRRRRYLEQHPDVVRRREARRALRRERRELERAFRAGDRLRYAKVAVRAMRVACAPHYPAEPRALVCRDVLESLPEAERAGRTGEVVRRFFGLVDESIFSATGAHGDGLLALRPELDQLLAKLEARL